MKWIGILHLGRITVPVTVTEHDARGADHRYEWVICPFVGKDHPLFGVRQIQGNSNICSRGEALKIAKRVAKTIGAKLAMHSRSRGFVPVK